MNAAAITVLKSAAEILRSYRITTASTTPGRYYAICPRCSHSRKKAHQKLKCLGVTIDDEGVKFGCNHCPWMGGEFYHVVDRATESAGPAAVEKARAKTQKRQRIEAADSLKKVRWLWSQRQPIIGSIAETYLRECRGYQGRLPGTLGFLPARSDYPPAMIAAFGTAAETLPGEIIIHDAAVRGVHITRLKPDGSDKAGTEADKLTIGIANTSPIMLAPPNDLFGLAIAEGIEDGLSVYAATGLARRLGGRYRRPTSRHGGIRAVVHRDRDRHGRRRCQRREKLSRTGTPPGRKRHRGADGSSGRRRMKVEANQILREKGASALRGVMDAAHPFNGHNATSDEPTPHTEYPESADGEPDHGSSGRGREGVSLNDFHA